MKIPIGVNLPIVYQYIIINLHSVICNWLTAQLKISNYFVYAVQISDQTKTSLGAVVKSIGLHIRVDYAYGANSNNLNVWLIQLAQLNQLIIRRGSYKKSPTQWVEARMKRSHI